MTNNYCSIVFGPSLGIAIYSPSCELVKNGAMRLWKPEMLKVQMFRMRAANHIDFAVVEAFGTKTAIDSVYVDQIKEAFQQHILLHHDQWNPSRMGADQRKALVETRLLRKITQEQADAIQLGKGVFEILRSSAVPFPADYLAELACTTRRFPRRQYLRQMQGRMLQEAVHAN